MNNKRALHFGTADSPDPVSGYHLGMENERALRFGTPDSPDPYSGAHLGMEMKELYTLGQTTRQILTLMLI